MWLQANIKWHHLVLGRPRSFLFPRGIHSVTLIVHLLSRLSPRGPAHLCLLSLMLLIMSVTPLCFWIHSVLFLSLRVTYHDSLHLPLSSDQFLKLGVAKPDLTNVITGSISLNAFLFSLICNFCLALSSLQNALNPWPILLFWSWSFHLFIQN